MFNVDRDDEKKDALRDFGVTTHMIINKKSFINSQSVDTQYMTAAGGTRLSMRGIGLYRLTCELLLKDVYHIPGFIRNIISVSKLNMAGLTTRFENGIGRVCNPKGSTLFQMNTKDDLYTTKTHFMVHLA